jgi:eukaryotic-like serine/threonine-protein kinase
MSPDEPATRLTPERWRQVEAIFLATRDREPNERAPFLEQSCGADVALRHEVESLLAADQGATGFLNPPGALVPPVSDLEAVLRAELAGRYTIEHELGRGGMATVFLAQDLKHHRAVAVKVLRPELAAAIGPERFLREIEIAAGLSHPHILPLFDSGSHDGLFYYVMPYVEGESLRQRLDRERQLPIEDALRITRQVSDGLGYAHRLGFVHRDIKPENILLLDQHAVIADFGIARAITVVGGEKLTEAGLAIGTPSYMSPEQALGDSDVDGRSDLYSLGCVLYEMLVGDPPFLGHTAQQVLARQVLDAVPPPKSVRPAVPVAVELALLQALAKAPADRFTTVHEFADALGDSLVSGPEATVVLRPTPPTQSIAVLSFLNMSGDPDDEYLGDGIAEELINLLASIRGLRVVSRTSAFVFKGTKTNPRTIGQTLNVRTVLTGSVRRSGNRLRVTSQLISAADGFHLWSERYDREMADVFAIQDEISQTIVSALQIRLTGTQAEQLAKRGTVDPEAYDAYLRGRHHWNNRPIGIPKAVEFFRQAIAKDPDFALAYTGLSDCYGTMGAWESNIMLPHHAWPEAAAAARRALELDESLGEAHTSLAHMHLHYDWNWPAAEREFRRAVELKPAYSPAHHWFSHYLMAMGRIEASLAESRRCLELDPVDLVNSAHLSWHYWLAGQPDEAIEQSCKTRELHPDHFMPEFFLGVSYERKGVPDVAIAHLEIAATRSGGIPYVLASLAHAYAAAGKRRKALELLGNLDALSQEHYVPAYDRVIIYVGLGQVDQAMEWLQRAYDEHSSWISYLNVEPRLDPLRGDARFTELVRKLGFPTLH